MKTTCSNIPIADEASICNCGYMPPVISFSNCKDSEFKEYAVLTSDDGRKFEILNIDEHHVSLKQVP